jgi:hypothetical protein
MTKKIILSLVVSALVASVGFVAAEENKQTSEDVSYATYGESGDRVKVVVSSLAAKIEKPKEFLPLQVAIGLRGAGPEISFNYQSFQLIDGQGNYAATSTPEDLQANHEFWMETQRMREMRPIVTGDYFSGYKTVASMLYPKTGSYGGTNLDQNMAFQDVIFFPLPESLDGVMTLVVMGTGMEDPVEVRFEVPHKHKKHHEENKN